MPSFKEDRLSASKWAYNLLQSDFVVLDTETTGLGPDAEICEIAITNKHGRNLFSSLVKPSRPIPAQASAIHGIRNEMVDHSPVWAEVFPFVLGLLRGQTVVIYNASYDMGVMYYCCVAACRPWISGDEFVNSFSVQCAMLPYSAYCSDWNGYHGNYRWQKLPAGDHSALGDCRATTKVIKLMAQTWAEHIKGAKELCEF